MCFDLDSRPPIAADRRRGARRRHGSSLTGRRRQPVPGVPRAAGAADRRRDRHPARRPRPPPVLRGAGPAVRGGRHRCARDRLLRADGRHRRAARRRLRVHAARRRRPRGPVCRPTSGRRRRTCDRPTHGAVRSLFTVGFCFGGRLAFLSSTLGLGLAGAIGFYGTADGPCTRAARRRRPRSAGSMVGAVLGLFGGADQGIPAEAVAAFDAALAAAGVDHRLVTYAGRAAQLLRPQGRRVRRRERGGLGGGPCVHRGRRPSRSRSAERRRSPRPSRRRRSRAATEQRRLAQPTRPRKRRGRRRLTSS